MAKYNVTTTGITAGLLYKNVGDQSVVYNSGTYTTGQTFRGISGVTTFTFSGTGTQIVNELIELGGGSIEFTQNTTEYPAFNSTYELTTSLNGGSVQFTQLASELRFEEITTFNSGGIEFVQPNSFVFTISTNSGRINLFPPSQILPTRIAYFGDSMTAGTSNYPVKIFNKNGIAYTNYGVGGAKVCSNTYAPTGGTTDLIDKYTTEVNIGYSGQLVSFAYGQNDIPSDYPSWKAAYKQIIQAFINAGWPLNRLLIIAEPSYDGTTKATIRANIDQIAFELGILKYTVYQRFMDTGQSQSYYLQTDLVHPIDAGQELWASGYETFLRQ